MTNTTEQAKKKTPAKRVEILSLRVVKNLELMREGSIDYLPRKISSSQDAVNLCRKFLSDLPEERMFVIALDTKNQFNSISNVSIGTLSSSLAHPREIYKVAIASNSNSIIVGSILVAHNHPSGNPEPSDEDIAISRRLKKAGEILGIPLLDHIIIGDEDQYVSLKDRGIL